ncbi:hypothetical protein AAFC00_005901 [Neodothiora populina]|uniref:FAD-binding FR-type domain-containing protein n=1 Tax=Neodothiora populina TaxID=2781224 RepID=A0ABR3P7J4_9PEZI
MDVVTIASVDTSGFGTQDAAESERRAKVVQGVLFSRRFIVTYNVVLCLILLCLTAVHWGRRVSHTRNLATEQNGSKISDVGDTNAVAISAPTSSGSSSSSSTLTSPTQAERRKDEDETSPLINTAPRQRSRSLALMLRSWMMYQPPNIPVINKTLPSNATSVAVLLFIGLNIFYLLFRVPLVISFAFVLADRAGLLFVANLPLLYLCAAKNQPIKWLTGHSYERLNIIHRRLGEWMCFVALVHAAGMVTTWYTLLSEHVSFWRFLAIPLVWLGIGAFIAYEALYLTSLGSLRQRFYELFLALHVFLQVAALGFLFFHHPATRLYVGIALGIFAIDRVVCRLGLKTRTMVADLSIMEDGETVLLSSDWSITKQISWWRRRFDIRNGWQPSEHVFLTVPALSRKHIIQAHPFTIASAAPETSSGEQSTHAWLNFVIRAHDGFSREFLRYAQSHRSADVRVDGPYGSLHALEMLRASEHAAVVAGGTGIAVAYPLLWDLLFNHHTKSSNSPRRVTLIWIVHDATHVDWIGQERLDELKHQGLAVVIPPPTRKAGQPDVEALLQALLTTTDCQTSASKVGVVVSGPDSMNRTARNACARLAWQGLDVNVSVEKYGW